MSMRIILGKTLQVAKKRNDVFIKYIKIVMFSINSVKIDLKNF